MLHDQIREVTPDDLELICRHREEMFRDAGTPEAVLIEMTEHFRPWLAPRLEDGTYFGYVISSEGHPVAGVGLMLIDWPPHRRTPLKISVATSSICTSNLSTAGRDLPRG